MSEIFNLLSESLHPELQHILWARVDRAVRGLAYLVESQNADMAILQHNGWGPNRLQVVIELGAFYQLVLGPLASTSRGGGKLGLASVIPIRCGRDTRFDQESAQTLKRMAKDFFQIASECGIERDWLTASNEEDLVRAIARKYRGEDGF